jgi:type IV pilus assembly protein PilE
MNNCTDSAVGRASVRLPVCRDIEPRNRAAGVTLIELMVVVIVIGILGIVAIPSYRQFTLRAHRTEAKTALLRVATNQERWYLQNRTYTNDLNALGFPSMESENGVYVLAIPVANVDTFTATATPKPGGGTNGVDMTQDPRCTSFTLNAQGVRTSAPDTDCW